MSSEAGLAALLLGTDAAQQIYSLSEQAIDSQIRTISPENSPFLLRLREALMHCCRKVGSAAAYKHLLLPEVVGRHLMEMGTEEKPNGRKPKVACVVTESPEDDAPDDSEETKQKGIKVTYIAELFSIESPKLVHSWSNWSKRAPGEMESNLEKRAQIQALLDQGETMKAICQELRMKPKHFREFLGQPSGPIFSREVYEKVMQQMQIVKVKSTVSKWLEGKDVPEPDAIMDDSEATRDIKRLAIENFYEHGSASAAAINVRCTPSQVKRWVADFQRIVDKKYSRCRERLADVTKKEL